MYDIFYLKKSEIPDGILNKLRKRFPLIKVVEYSNSKFEALSKIKQRSMTKFFWVIDLDNDYQIMDNFNFDYVVPEWDKIYVHVWKKKNNIEENSFGNIFLISKDYLFSNREARYFFFVNKKEILIEASKFSYEILQLKKTDNYYDSITTFQQECNTSMFWVLAPECKLLTDLTYVVPDYDKEYVHQWTPINYESPNLFLILKEYPVSKREAEHLFFISKKEMDEQISKVGYDILQLEFNDNIYEKISSFRSTTSMFWVLAPECKLLTDLTYVVPDYDKEYVHQWTAINNEHSRLNLIPKNYPIAKKEANSLFFINKKEMGEGLFKEIYDIIFVSYNEPNADQNWSNLLNRFPTAKRVHGVKGIHNAHIQSARISTTSMFWVVDGDSQILDDFDLDYVVQPWDKDSVFVWKSKNPVNNLIYGYGGVKLLPKELTLKLDTLTVDMTTSISKKFNSMDAVSNLTVFNTDPFNTWKSAFRECVKLSSKVIDGQIDNETEHRLNVWCTIGSDKSYGEYSIKGALMGKEFGLKHFNDKHMLSKINDWGWLNNEFNKF
jgi:hypothetical protein